VTDVYTPVAVDVPHGMALHLAYLLEDQTRLEELQYGLDPAAIDECMRLVHDLFDAWRISASNVGSTPSEPTPIHPGYSVKAG
jgi:hypothetical protein